MVEDRRDRKPLHCVGFIKYCTLRCFQVDWRRRKTKALLRFVRSISLQADSNVKSGSLLGTCNTTFDLVSTILSSNKVLLALDELIGKRVYWLMVIHVGGHKTALHTNLRYADDDGNGLDEA